MWKEWKEFAVLADVHLGIEFDIKYLGFKAPFILENYIKLFNQISQEKLIILGDLKHEILTVKSTVKKFLDFLSNNFKEIIIIKGNHDGKIEEIAKEFKNIKICKYLFLDRHLFIHGHTKLPQINENFKIIYMGHIHPAISLLFEENSLFSQEFIKCYLKYENNIKIEVFPAFNPLIIGTNVLEFNFDLPIFRQLEINPENFKIIIENIKLGNLREIKKLYYNNKK